MSLLEESATSSSSSTSSDTVRISKFKVFTLNCYAIAYVPLMSSPHRRVRINALIDHLEEADYDFVCLQEVWTESDQFKIKNRCKQNFPFSVTFFGGIIGTGTMLMSRWPIVATHFQRFSMNGFIHHLQYGDALTGAGIGCAKIRTGNDVLVNLYVSHFHAEYNRAKDPYLADRVVQAMEAGNFINMTSTGSDLNIYCGDFNTEPGDLPHKILTEIFHLKDSHEVNSSSVLKTHYRKDNTFTEAHIDRPITIDYIMHKTNGPNSTSRTIDLEIPLEKRIPNSVETSYSDHEPLLATIIFEKSDDNLDNDNNLYNVINDDHIWRKTEDIYQETLEILSSELDSNWFWQLTHSSCLFLTLVFIVNGLLNYDGICGMLSGMLFGFGFLFFVFLILFYQHRRYSLRQVLAEVRLRQESLNKDF